PACAAPCSAEGHRVEILTSINDVSATEWNALVGTAGVARTHAYLAAMEGAKVADCRYYYPVVRDRAGAIVAHACVYIVETDFVQLMPTWVAMPTRWLRRWWPRL